MSFTRRTISSACRYKRAMRQRHALGSSGAAAGVEQFGNGHFVVGENVGAFRVPGVEDFFIGQIRAARNLVAQANPSS